MSNKYREVAKKREFSDVSNAKNMKEELIPEEFPDGPLGSPIRAHESPQLKSTSWKPGQKRKSAYTYEDKERHDDLPRQMPGSHPLHDE
ncbi:MAG TPA: hypothetical protein VK029_07185 [Pseudogracilibacillus sp.]|nr:hypothetical protein [Pseudogracilibacillus sp.]